MMFLEVTARIPYYSVATRSYQVRSTYLLPPPSTLKGALAKGLLYMGLYNGESLDKASLKIMDFLEKNILFTTVIPLSPVIVSSVLLKRLRTLQGDKAKVDIDAGEEASDAMLREYSHMREQLLIYVLKGDKTTTNILKEAASLIDQIGDTESIGNVIQTRIYKPDKKTIDNNTCNNYIPLTEHLADSQYIVQYMPLNSLYPSKAAKKGKTEPYILPLKEEYMEKHNIIFYTPKCIPKPKEFVSFSIEIPSKQERRSLCIPRKILQDSST